jgi:hypothetical protein
VKKLFYWLPRILSVLFVVFISVFSLDVFGEYDGWSVIIPLLIHLIPSFVVLVLVVFAWKHDLAGSIIFFGIALLYVLMVGFNRHWSWYVGISGPAALVGLLFLLNWLRGRKAKKRK